MVRRNFIREFMEFVLKLVGTALVVVTFCLMAILLA